MDKKIVWVLLLTVLTLSAAGCAPSDANPADQVAVQLTDALGRSVEFAEPPADIVITGKASPLIVNTLYLFPQAKERVTHYENRMQTSQEFLPLVDPLAKQKADLERDAGAEQIAPLKPDVVLLKSYLKADLGDPIEQTGLKVFYLDLETPEAFYSEVEMLGTFFGDSQRSQVIIDYYQSRVQAIEDRTKGITDDQRPTVLVLQYSLTGDEVAFKVPPATWLQTSMVEAAGGKPVWTEASSGSGWSVVSVEQIAVWDPELIFLVDYKGNAPQVVASLSENKTWQSIPVMAAGKVYPFPCDFLSWDQPDPRWILGQSWLAKMIHPEVFADLNIRAETSDFYMQMYGLSAEQVDQDVMPLLADYVPFSSSND